jgi:hypothetical protein
MATTILDLRPPTGGQRRDELEEALDMNTPMGTIIAHGATPPWLPRDVAEGRKFAWWGQLMFFLMAFIWFVLAIVGLVLYATDGGRGMLIMGSFGFFAMLICLLAGVFMKKTVIDAIDQGRFHDARNDSLIWILFGLVGFVIPALFMILTYAKLSDAVVSQAPVGYQPYQSGQVAVQHPGAYMPPPAAAAPPPAPIQAQAQQPAHPAGPAHHNAPMVRCKNCSVQFPQFMHSCPNCGAPKE